MKKGIAGDALSWWWVFVVLIAVTGLLGILWCLPL